MHSIAQNLLLTPTETDDHPAAIPSTNRPVKRSGLTAGPSNVTVSNISNHPIVQGMQQRMMDSLRPRQSTKYPPNGVTMVAPTKIAPYTAEIHEITLFYISHQQRREKTLAVPAIDKPI